MEVVSILSNVQQESKISIIPKYRAILIILKDRNVKDMGELESGVITKIREEEFLILPLDLVGGSGQGKGKI